MALLLPLKNVECGVADDETWAKWRRLSGLPDEARDLVNEVFAIYRLHNKPEGKAFEQSKSPNTKRFYSRVSRQASRFLELLNKTRHSDEFMELLSYVLRQENESGVEAFARAEALVGNVTHGIMAIAAVTKAVQPKPGSKKHALLRAVLEPLNLILKLYTGGVVSRAKLNNKGYQTNRFAIELLQLASDGELTDSEIKNAIQRQEKISDESVKKLGKKINARQRARKRQGRTNVAAST
jgi:hypothetical protein